MKHPDLDRAFGPTPEIVHLSMESAFRKGEKAMKLRHKIIAMASVAAVLALACGLFAFALPNEPRPDVVAQPQLCGEPTIVTVYYNPYGKYYHYEEHCSGMRGAEPHSLQEAEYVGKLPCPVCVAGGDAVVSIEVQEPDFGSAGYGEDIFLKLFGTALESTYPGWEMYSCALHTEESDGVLTRTVDFSFRRDQAEEALCILSWDSRQDVLMSGSVIMRIPEGFDEDGFMEKCNLWYKDAYNGCLITLSGLDSLGMDGAELSNCLREVYAYFDSECKPSICTFEFETEIGHFTLAWDIFGDEAELATQNYMRALA